MTASPQRNFAGVAKYFVFANASWEAYPFGFAETGVYASGFKINLESKEMMNKTESLYVRLTQEEGEAFKHFAEGLGETRARVLQKMIRESINGVPELLYDKQSSLMPAIRKLVGIADNLNQITAAMHSGKIHRTVDENYLAEVKRYVLDVRSALEDPIKKTKNRWVKH